MPKPPTVSFENENKAQPPEATIQALVEFTRRAGTVIDFFDDDLQARFEPGHAEVTWDADGLEFVWANRLHKFPWRGIFYVHAWKETGELVVATFPRDPELS
jgi:hypothetical protein